MILMWLGPVILMLAGVEIFRRSLSRLGQFLQQRFLQLKTPVTDFKMLVTAKLAALSQSSIAQNQLSAMALINARVFSRRYAMVLLCLSAIGAWSTLLILALAWQMSGFYILAFALVPYLYSRWTRKGQAMAHTIFLVIFGLGLALIGAEWTLRQQSVLLAVLGESDFHFLLADGRFSAQMFWLAVGFAITLAVGFESWAVFLGLVLVVAGSMSLNGAIALIVGELLAWVILVVWRSRNFNGDARGIAKGYAISSAVGILVGFVMAGYLRDAFAWSVTFDASQMVEKTLQLLFMFVVVLLGKSLFAMGWGHFAARKLPDEVQTGEYFSMHWWEHGFVSDSVMGFIRAKLADRSRLILLQSESLSEDGSKIPVPLMKLHREESDRLVRWLAKSDKSREKF